MACNPKLPLKATALRDLVDTVNQLEERHDNALNELGQKIDNDISNLAQMHDASLNELENEQIQKMHPVLGKYELIKTLTLTEDVSSARISDVDGSPINLNACFVKTNVPAAANLEKENVMLAVRYYLDSSSFVMLRNETGISKSQITFGVYGACRVVNGYWECEPAKYNNNRDVPMMMAPMPYMAYSNQTKYDSAKYPYIKEIMVHTASGYTLPAGTVISVWGVKANA